MTFCNSEKQTGRSTTLKLQSISVLLEEYTFVIKAFAKLCKFGQTLSQAGYKEYMLGSAPHIYKPGHIRSLNFKNRGLFEKPEITL